MDQLQFRFVSFMMYEDRQGIEAAGFEFTTLYYILTGDQLQTLLTRAMFDATHGTADCSGARWYGSLFYPDKFLYIQEV